MVHLAEQDTNVLQTLITGPVSLCLSLSVWLSPIPLSHPFFLLLSSCQINTLSPCMPVLVCSLYI